MADAIDLRAAFQTEDSLKKCYNITPANMNAFEGKLVFIYDAPPIPEGARHLSTLQWLRIYTILYHKASGGDGYYDRFLTIRALRALHVQTFGCDLVLADWQVQDENEIGEKLYPLVKTWLDAYGTISIRLLLAEETPVNVTYPALDWKFEPLNNGNTDWKLANEQLRTNFITEYCKVPYLLQKLRPLFTRFPHMTPEWASDVRAKMYAMFVSHFAAGVDSAFVIPAYKRMYGHDLTQDLHNSCTIDIITGYLVDDFSTLVRESEVYANLYPRFFLNVEIPTIIRHTRKIRKEGKQMTVNGTRVLMANTLY